MEAARRPTNRDRPNHRNTVCQFESKCICRRTAGALPTIYSHRSDQTPVHAARPNCDPKVQTKNTNQNYEPKLPVQTTNVHVCCALHFIIYLFEINFYFFCSFFSLSLSLAPAFPPIETSLPWKYPRQQPQASQLMQSKRSADQRRTDELVYFTYASDPESDKNHTMRQKIEKHLLQVSTCASFPLSQMIFLPDRY